MTVAMIWVLVQMEAPWWTYVATGVAFCFKALICLAAFDKDGK